MADRQAATINQVVESFNALDPSEMELELEGMQLIKEMIIAVMDARKSAPMDQGLLKSLLSLAIAPGRGNPRRETTLLNAGISKKLVEDFTGRITEFRNRTGRDLSRISHGALEPLRVRQLKGAPYSRFFKALDDLLGAIIQQPVGSEKSCEEFRNTLGRLNDFPLGITARSIAPVLYALSPEAFPLNNSWVKAGIRGLLGHEAKSPSEYLEAMEKLPEILRKIGLPANYGALDQALSTMRESKDENESGFLLPPLDSRVRQLFPLFVTEVPLSVPGLYDISVYASLIENEEISEKEYDNPKALIERAQLDAIGGNPWFDGEGLSSIWSGAIGSLDAQEEGEEDDTWSRLLLQIDRLNPSADIASLAYQIYFLYRNEAPPLGSHQLDFLLAWCRQNAGDELGCV